MCVDLPGWEASGFVPGLAATACPSAVQTSYEHPEWGVSVWSGLVLALGVRQQGPVQTPAPTAG